MSRRVNFSPDGNEKTTVVFDKYGVGTKVGGNKKRVIGIWSFRVTRNSGFSPVKFLKQIGTKVATVVHFVSSTKKCSRKVSSASLGRSRSHAEPLDSHRAEAIEDCIEFLNSSSSLQRSNSVSTCSC